MRKQNALNSDRPKDSKNQSALTVKVIITLAALGFVTLTVVGYWFVTEHSVRIVFVTTNVLSLLTLAIIAFQTIIYRRQSDILERQLVATEKAAEASYIAQRAYIGVTDLKMQCSTMFSPGTAPILIGAIPTLFVTWHNGGGSPAEHFRSVPYLSFGEKPQYKGYFIDDDISDMRFNFIPAGKVIENAAYPQVEVGFPPFTKEMIDQLESGQKRLYAIINALYTDFQGQQRQVNVEAIYDPIEGTFSDIYEWAKD
jgi:hypothetical protein